MSTLTISQKQKLEKTKQIFMELNKNNSDSDKIIIHKIIEYSNFDDIIYYHENLYNNVGLNKWVLLIVGLMIPPTCSFLVNMCYPNSSPSSKFNLTFVYGIIVCLIFYFLGKKYDRRYQRLFYILCDLILEREEWDVNYEILKNKDIIN